MTATTTMRAARVTALALTLLLVASGTVSAQTGGGNATRFRDRAGGGNSGGPWAQPALIVLIVTLALVPLSLWRRFLAPRWASARATAAVHDIKAVAAWSKKTGVDLHMIFGAATLVLGTLQGFTARSQNAYLWAGMIGIGILLLLGTIMHWRWIAPLARQRTFMFGAKWALTILSIALLLYGHSITRPALG